ncbi:hypothetical protein SAMN06265348_109173 [Pedobacter westerhofensis]|uniref:FixH protein n=1 Tax=Pedobacter westerhofensis TaxID=425512 RepID=A0A521EV39_9SPHI|nr:FixH family protein [Pedobacter westerhofensis]SMO87818.1 hypothetical protein SAMN06265348_109173 [Pedobacter westerhofensis]
MNWGTKLILGMASFMLFIAAMVLIMFNSKKDALVDTDYYEKGINYNKVYNRKEQTKTDHATPEVQANRDVIVIRFREHAKGTAGLMRTSDKALDKAVTFESNMNNQVIIPASQLKKGSWRLIIEWISNEKSYLYEQEIIL